MIKIKTFTFNPFEENTYILYDETMEAVIFDPGCYTQEEKQEIKDFIAFHNLKITQLINTHCHVDHVLGNNYIKELYKVPFKIPEMENSVLRAVKAYAPSYGFHAYEECEPDQYLSENDKITFGNSKLEILFVPGHSPGHLAFYSKEDNFCIAGDVLFYRSIGRTDLPGGNHQTLLDSIKNKMFSLPDSTVVYPGHGPATSIKDKKNITLF